MPLESTVICMDTSAWMINGDYLPNRLAAQQDAAGLLITFKLESNVESTVGLLAHGGKRVRVLMPPTDSEAALHACLDGLKASGPSSIVQGVKIAQLALKHRRNKNGGARIIIFIGSPIHEKKGALKKLGIQLRRSNISLDVIGLGEHDANRDKIQTLVDAANTEDNNCSYAPIPVGVPPSDALMSSPIVTGAAGGAGGAGAGAGAFAQYGGVNPELDPELAMTIAASLEQVRQTTEARDEASKTAETAETAAADSKADDSGDKTDGKPAAEASTAAAAGAATDMGYDSDDDAELRMAMALSLADATADAEAEASAPAAAAPAAAAATGDAGGEVAAAAADAGDGEAGDGDGEGEDESDDFIMSMLNDLPGVDQNDPAIQAMLARMRGEEDDEDEDEDEDEAMGN